MLVPSCRSSGKTERGAVQVCDCIMDCGAGTGVTGLLVIGVFADDEDVECSQCVATSNFSAGENNSFEFNIARGAGRLVVDFLG